MQPLRSPLRRLLVWLVGPQLAFGVFDLARVTWQQSPREVQADEFSARFFHEHVKLIGLAHFDDTLTYEIVHTDERSFFGRPVKVEPYALLPLNRPERSEGSLVLAEVPLVEGERVLPRAGLLSLDGTGTPGAAAGWL